MSVGLYRSVTYVSEQQFQARKPITLKTTFTNAKRGKNVDIKLTVANSTYQTKKHWKRVKKTVIENIEGHLSQRMEKSRKVH